MSALWETPVREYMSNALVSVTPETSLADVQGVLEDRDISAVPVLGSDGSLRGIVSTTDLLRVASIELGTTPSVRSAKIVAPSKRASDIMKTDVVTVDEDAPVREAAVKMVAHRIHRVVVLRKGKPAGVISARDAMRAVLFHHIESPIDTVMTSPVETIDLGESIRVAIVQLEAANVRGLVVVDGGWPIGVFTHAEALRCRAVPESILNAPLEEVMSYEMFCLSRSTPLYRAAGHAIQMRVRRILVVEDRRVCGVLSGFDLVRVMTRDDL